MNEGFCDSHGFYSDPNDAGCPICAGAIPLKSALGLHCEKWIEASGLATRDSDYKGMVGIKLQGMVREMLSHGGNSGGSMWLLRSAFNAMLDAYEKVTP